MKKIIAGLLFVCALLGCVSCAGGGNGAAQAYVFVYDGVEVSIDAELSSLIEELGKYDRHETSPSCNHDGDAHFYYYGTQVEIESYPKNGKDYVYKVTLFDDTVKTEEGIRIGDSREDVTDAYGEATEEKGSALLYRAGNMYLQFTFSKGEDGKVTQIQYVHPDAIA
ncbi:MAG: hypothetical protein E7643_07545 [Ruminococcaceae bacterium]|nr:hypothetical protein [Oscillospiraceae bacterium]